MEVQYRWFRYYRNKSEKGNQGLYLQDKNGKKYVQKAGSSLVYTDAYIRSGQVYNGWIDFPLIAPDSFVLSFNNDRLGISIRNLTLNEPVILFEEFPLKNPSLRMEYLKEDWDIIQNEGHPPYLVNKDIEGCTFQESPESEVKGKLKIQWSLRP